MKLKELQVVFDDGETSIHVGTVAMLGGKTFFEYDKTWIKFGIELSPFHLPLQKRSFQIETTRMLSSTLGLFSDSLPDGWGMLIMDRFFGKCGINRLDVSPLDRLAFLGDHAMGALCYHPPLDKAADPPEAVNIGATAREAFNLYEGRVEDAGRLLATIGGSPGGARPKALVGISDDGSRFISGAGRLPEGYSHWLVKFSTPAGRYEGVLESVYLRMAERAGINVPESMLITDDAGIMHLATRRFDRPCRTGRRHISTACGLLHADCRLPSLDYEVLINTAWKLTKNVGQVKEQYRRAVFNLYAANRDDHSKNHGYLMLRDGTWLLSPAYDLTFSMGPGGEHWTSYCGEGRNPGLSHLMKLAEIARIGRNEAIAMIEQVKSAVAEFSRLAKESGVNPKASAPISARLEQILKG